MIRLPLLLSQSYIPKHMEGAEVGEEKSAAQDEERLSATSSHTFMQQCAP